MNQVESEHQANPESGLIHILMSPKALSKGAHDSYHYIIDI